MDQNKLHHPGLIIWDHDGTLVNTELREFELFPGIREILFDLKNIGFDLAIWTNRPRASTLASIKRLEIAAFIGEIYCYDDGLPKPNAQGLIKVSGDFPKSRVLHIGDSMGDVEGALSFGVDVIGACWYSSALKDSFRARTPLVAMKVDDCREMISKKFNVNL